MRCGITQTGVMMGIRQKLFLPFALSVLLLGGGAYWFLAGELTDLKGVFLRQMARAKANEVTQSVELLAAQALEQAALFSQLPEVQAAYAVALSGSIDDEKDPMAQQARETLRRDLAAHLASFEAVTGRKFKLHFHLPNGRSLVRLWSKKQIKRDGQDIDVSDDISSFRKTVVDVNRTGQPMKGIEVGRGGFDIRGVSPVKGADGRQIGSVEVLIEFAPLLKIASSAEGEDVLLYMNASLGSLAQGMSDTAKYPRVGNDFIFAAGNPGHERYRQVPARGQRLHLRRGQPADSRRRDGHPATAHGGQAGADHGRGRRHRAGGLSGQGLPGRAGGRVRAHLEHQRGHGHLRTFLGHHAGRAGGAAGGAGGGVLGAGVALRHPAGVARGVPDPRHHRGPRQPQRPAGRFRPGGSTGSWAR